MADQIADLAAELARMNDLLLPIVEAVAGYKQTCIGAGFSPAVAEQMALDYHRMMLAQIQSHV